MRPVSSSSSKRNKNSFTNSKVQHGLRVLRRRRRRNVEKWCLFDNCFGFRFWCWFSSFLLLLAFFALFALFARSFPGCKMKYLYFAHKDVVMFVRLIWCVAATNSIIFIYFVVCSLDDKYNAINLDWNGLFLKKFFVWNWSDRNFMSVLLERSRVTECAAAIRWWFIWLNRTACWSCCLLCAHTAYTTCVEKRKHTHTHTWLCCVDCGCKREMAKNCASQKEWSICSKRLKTQSVFAIVLNAAIHNTCNPCLCPSTLSQSRNYVSLCDCSSIRLKQPQRCISMHHVRTHSVPIFNANTKSIFTVSYFQLQSLAKK